MTFLKTKVEIFLPIRPRNINDPAIDIHKILGNNLFLYSSKLNGFPISYTIDGVFTSGRILDDGSIYVNCLIEFCILKIVPNMKMCCDNGFVLGTIPVTIEDQESGLYTGDFYVKTCENTRIVGLSMAEPEESDF